MFLLFSLVFVMHGRAEAWGNIPSGLNCSFASPDTHYGQDVVPTIGQQNKWSAVSWKGEIINHEILLWGKEDFEGVQIQKSNLLGDKGGIIPQTAIESYFMKYVISDDGGAGCGNNQGRPTQLIADVLDTDTSVRVENSKVQPVWLKVKIPPHTVADTYKGTITVGNAEEIKVLEMEIEVLDIALKAPSDWSYHLDLWQNPWSVARYHNVEPWSEEHQELMDPLITMLAEAGQKVITTTILDRAWNGQTYDAYKSMVKWTKKSDGSWTFNYDVFDAYVQFCMDRGISKQISCFTMVPWGNKHYYYDEASQTDKYLTLQPNTSGYNQHWQRFLEDFARHLDQKGWLDKTFIAMDERSDSDMQGVINLVTSVSPELKLSMATNHYTTVTGNVADICFGYSKIPSNIKTLVQERRAQNKNTTFYVCCADRHPNNFTYSPPAENVWLGWFAAKNDLDGSLRWAYNSWVEDPLSDTRHSRFQAGDCFFVYPDARSSVRFERLIEGVQDYEKTKALKAVLSPGWQVQLDKVLDTFVPNSNYTRAVNQGKEKLDWITKGHINGEEPPIARDNLALNKPTEASTSESAYDRGPEKANDGQSNTRWCAINGDSNQWWKVDLGKIYSIDEIGIQWELDNKKYDYIIETSIDGDNWVELIDRRDNASMAQNQVVETSGEARYLKLTVTGLSSGSWASFYELHVYGQSTNKALGKSVDASSCECSYGRGGDKAVDGDRSTRWCASTGTTPQWVILDMGTMESITSYKIVWEFDQKKYDYQIDVSENGSDWSTVVDKSDNQVLDQIQEGDITIQSPMQYIRLNVLGLQPGSWASLYEFEIY